MTYVFTDDYKADMHHHISAMYKQAKKDELSREERLQASHDVVEAYVAHTGERPDGNALERLATLILREELTDMHPDKMTREEYPIMSDRQRDTRERGELSLKAVQDVGTDGQDYRVQSRDNNRKMRELFGRLP